MRVMCLFLMIMLTTVGASIHAATVRLRWTAPTLNDDGTPLTDLAGHRVYQGDVSRQYNTVMDVRLSTEAIVSGLSEGRTYWWAVTAYDHSGNESDYSGEASATIPMPTEDLPPVAAITFPTEGSTVPRGKTITIRADASDDSQVIAEVRIRVENSSGTRLRTCILTHMPYTCAWQVPRQRGATYRLKAIATDGAGQQTTSAIVQVTAK